MSTAEMVAYAFAPAQVAYEPGPSFVDVATMTLDTSDMPGWLQDFGSSVDAGDTHMEPTSAETVDTPLTGGADASLPRWLSEPRPGAPADTTFADLPWDTDEAGNDATPASASFISEDDLPEWLRAISGDVAAEPALTTESMPTPSANGGFPIPAVVQAWVIAHQMVALAAGESLMAHLATEDEAHAESQPSEPASAPASASVDVVLRTESAATPAAGGRHMRIILLILVIMALLLLMVLYRSAA